MDLDERSAQILQTRNLIDSHPRQITLHRPEKRRTASGGIEQGQPRALDPQEFFLGAVSAVEAARFARDRSTFTTTDIGERHRSTFALVGMPDADMQERDHFFIGTDRYQVLFVDPTTQDYQKKAIVVRYV